MPIITKVFLNALSDVIMRQHAMESEQNGLRLDVYYKYIEQSVKEKTPEKLNDIIIAGARADIETSKANDVKISDLRDVALSYPLRYNKMTIISEKVLADLEGSVLSEFTKGHITQCNKPALPDIDANPRSFWGTSQSTFLSASLLSVIQSLAEENMEALPNSSIVAFSTVPERLRLEGRNIVTSAEQHFGYVHSGYSLGGSRIESTIMWSQNRNKPVDCSDWVAQKTGVVNQYTALAQLFLSRLQRGAAEGANPEWEASAERAEMQEKYVLIPNLADIQPGDVIFFKKFAEGEDKETSNGGDGHTGIVVGLPDQTSIKIISASGDMPGVEGFVINSILLAGSDRVVGAFRLKEAYEAELSIDARLSSLVGENFENLSDLWAALEPRMYPDESDRGLVGDDFAGGGFDE